MAFAHSQASLQAHTSLGTTTRTFTATAANRLVVVTVVGGPAATSITLVDTQTNTWNTAVAFTKVAGIGSMQVFWALAKNTTATTLTGTIVGDVTFIAILVDEFSGNDTSSPFDTGNSAGSTTVTAAPTLTTGADACMVYESIVDSATGAGTGFTLGASDTLGEISAYKFLGTSTSGTSQGTAFAGTTGGSVVSIASFKQPVSAAVNTGAPLLMMGIG